MVIHKKRASPFGERTPWHTLPMMPARQARNPLFLGSKVRHMEIPVAMWKEAQMNLFTLCRYWGAAERGWGS